MHGHSWLRLLFTPDPIAALAPDGKRSRRQSRQQSGVSAEQQAFLDALTQVEVRLNNPQSKRGWDTVLGLYSLRPGSAAPFRGKDLRRIEQLCARLWLATGTGRSRVEQVLLTHIAAACDESSLPFLRSALDVKRVADSFATERRQLVVAALAFTALLHDSEAARAELTTLLSHAHPSVRCEAIECFAQIHRSPQGRLAPDAAQRLLHIAQHDRAFAPRFIARDQLARAGVPVPPDPDAAVYAFRASLGRAVCTVELTASQTLADLADAILSAFLWDDDHLYEFALTGDLRDRRFVVPTESEEPLFFDEDEDEDEDEDDAPLETESGLQRPLGTFGFVRGHSMIFHFDFGDSHRFNVAVAAIHAHKTPRAKYPRIIDRPDKPPQQYPSAGAWR